jgi:anti-sigma factor RsiW
MTICEAIQPRLGDLLDGTLDAVDRDVVQAHVRECDRCAGLVRDFDRLRQAAQNLGPIDPPAHVWLELAGQLRQATPPALAVAPVPNTGVAPAWQWAGLAAALLVITTGTYVFLRLERPAPPQAPTAAVASSATGSVQVFADELSEAMTHYEKAIAELEVITKTNNGSLDPTLAATLQKNLLVIDGAISESRTAFTRDPTSVPARDSLLEALQRKVSVLQETVALMNEIRKGDQAGAAHVAAGFSKKS